MAANAQALLPKAAWHLDEGSGDKDNDTVGWLFKLEGDGLQFVADAYDTSAVTRDSAGSLTMNVWQHVVATWDGSSSGSQVHIYIDGVASDGSASNGGGNLKPDDSG